LQFPLPGTPLANVWARAENAAGDCAEVQTGADGIAHIKVDPAKGPFDVTVAIAGYTAISFLGQTGPIPGNVIMYQTGSASVVKQSTITGKITWGDAGKAPNTIVQIDGWDFATVVTKPADTTYSTNYQYYPANLITLPLAAIEYDPDAGVAVNAVYTNTGQRSGNPMTVDIAFPDVKVPPVKSTVTLNFPASGFLTDKSITKVGSPVPDAHIGNAIVTRLTPDELGAEQFVGIGSVDLPAAGKTQFHLQTFTGKMAPDIAEALMSGPTLAMFVQPHDLTDGASLTLGQINTLENAGTNLGDLTWDADSAGYDYVVAELDASSKTSSTALWTVYSQGAKLTKRSLPHLPSSVAQADLGPTINNAFVSLQQYKQGAPQPWQAVRSDIQVVVTANALAVDSAGR
jgi:hypothetical protein